jgi:HSP20 family protein
MGDTNKGNRPGGNANFLDGLTNLISSLADLAEKGEQLKRDGTLKTDDGKEYRVQYGVNIRTASDGRGGRDVKVEPFGNVKHDKNTGEASVAEIREPATDVFEEDDHVLVVAEMPGVAQENVEATVEGDILTIAADQGEKRYRKEVLLPQPFEAEAMAVTMNNGVLEIKLSR